MVERITDPHKPVLLYGTGRIPDGHVVPNPHRSAPEPERTRTRYERAVLWLVLTVVALAVTIRALR